LLLQQGLIMLFNSVKPHKIENVSVNKKKPNYYISKKTSLLCIGDKKKYILLFKSIAMNLKTSRYNSSWYR